MQPTRTTHLPINILITNPSCLVEPLICRNLIHLQVDQQTEFVVVDYATYTNDMDELEALRRVVERGAGYGAVGATGCGNGSGNCRGEGEGEREERDEEEVLARAERVAGMS